MSTLFVNNLNTASGSTITVPTGKTLVGTDSKTFRAPGMVIQETFTTYNTQYSQTISANSYGSYIGITGTITPTSSSNTIRGLVIVEGITLESDGTYGWFELRTETPSDALVRKFGYPLGWSSDDNSQLNLPIQFTHSPNTTSAVKYRIRFYAVTGDIILRTNRDGSSYGNESSVFLQEIQAWWISH